MILKRNAERLQKQLEEQKEYMARIAGYALLPKAEKVKVINVPDSSLYKDPNGDSCIGYWEKQTGHEIKNDSVYYCPACGKPMSKKSSTLDGAHVYKEGNPKEWFFTPLCSKCNNPENQEPMNVDTTLVPVPQECYEKKNDGDE